MADKQVTYVRTMKINYTNISSLSMNNERRLNTLLYDKGLASVGSFGGKERLHQDRYGVQEFESTTNHYEVHLDGKCIYSNSRAASSLVEAIAIAAGIDLQSRKKIVVETSERECMPQGENLVFMDWDGLRFGYAALNSQPDGVMLQIKFYEGSYSRPTSLTFITTHESDRVLNKKEIERLVVDGPLEMVGRAQAIVESSLSEMGYNVDEVDIECHFDAKTESRSECTPDIIARTRAEKMKHTVEYQA
jgi:hypothetical protein